MAYKISDSCIKCGACAAGCPVSCIHVFISKSWRYLNPTTIIIIPQ